MTGRPVARRRYLLCSTPAQGHTAPLLALARHLSADDHVVTFFTTAHYRRQVEATGASFIPFAPDDDAHDLMVANPDRESSSRRGVRGVKDDLRRIFIGPLPGQYRELRRILADSPADCIVVDTMFFGALPLALGPAAARPALACIGVMPYASSQSRHGAVRDGPPTWQRPGAPRAQSQPELAHRARGAARHPAFRAAPAGRDRDAQGGSPGTSSTSSPKWSMPTSRRR